MKCIKQRRIKDFELYLNKTGELMVKRKRSEDYYSLYIFQLYIKQGVILP